MIENISGYIFKISDLKIEKRLDGISGFIRTRNGEEFLEEVILSHIDFFDEIVVVYHQSFDNTEKILKKLLNLYCKKLKVYHYTDKIYEMGSKEYNLCDTFSVASLANYSNFALAKTTYKIVSKIDDDHIAIAKKLKSITDTIKRDGLSDKEMLCYSGINLAVKNGICGITKHDPISGSGDIGFFRVSYSTFFKHTSKFEHFQSQTMKKRNLGLLYIHTKFLKRDNGFANYKLFDGYNKRFCRKYKKYLLTEIIGMKELYHIISPNMIKIILSFFHIKYKFLVKRNIMIQREIKKMNLLQFLNNNIANWHESLKLTNNIKIKE